MVQARIQGAISSIAKLLEVRQPGRGDANAFSRQRQPDCPSLVEDADQSLVVRYHVADDLLPHTFVLALRGWLQIRRAKFPILRYVVLRSEERRVGKECRSG